MSNVKTTIAQLALLPAECPIAFTEGTILKVFNRSHGVSTTPPNRPYAFQEIQLGECDNPTITYPCRFVGVEFPTLTAAHIGTKLQFVSAKDTSGKTSGVKIKADKLKAVPGQPQGFRNVLWVTPSASVVGLPAAAAPAPAAAAPAPSAPAPEAPVAPVRPPLTEVHTPQPAPPLREVHTPPPAPPLHAPTDAELKQDLKHCCRLANLLAVTAMTIDKANAAYQAYSGNQFSSEFTSAMAPTMFLALFKDYGRTMGMDSHMPVCSSDAFAETLKRLTGK